MVSRVAVILLLERAHRICRRRCNRIGPGDTINLDPSVTVRCIAASGAVLGAPTTTSDDENDLSVSLLIEFAGFKAFFGDDTHSPIEDLIGAEHLAQDVDLQGQPSRFGDKFVGSVHGRPTTVAACDLQCE